MEQGKTKLDKLILKIWRSLPLFHSFNWTPEGIAIWNNGYKNLNISFFI